MWVDLQSVWDTNNPDKIGWKRPENWLKKVNSIMGIAWTITTDVPQGNIEDIIRQGDCILVKPKGEYEPLNVARHLTEKEYKTLISAES
jgi:hypothetical protein